jgi:uncharacterized protein (DUF1684 family)
MKTKNIIVVIAVVVAIVSTFYSLQDSEGQAAYLKTIQKERDEKDHFLRTSSESPFNDHKNEFKGLNYFPPDIRYKITAALTPIEEKKAVVLHTSDAKEEHYLPYAYAEFDLDNVHNTLLILEIMEMGPSRGTLFLAFGDDTSAKQTYGAGRYLDLKKAPGSSTITLDFNKAYNPYCAYNDNYSCPLPPTENLLHIPISAGEKSYHDE